MTEVSDLVKMKVVGGAQLMLLLSLRKKQSSSFAGSSVCQKDSLVGEAQTRLVERLAQTVTCDVSDFLCLRPSSES